VHGLGAAPTSFPEVVGCGAGGALAAGGERARGARLRLLLLVLLLLRRHLPPLSSPLQEQIRISSFLPRHSCSDSVSSPRKIKSLRTPEGTGDKGGRKVDADRTRERGRERRGERKSLCAGREPGGRKRWAGTEMEVGGVAGFWMRRHPRRARHPPSYGRGRGSVAQRGTIHASTASDGDLLNAYLRVHPSDQAHLSLPNHAPRLLVATKLSYNRVKAT
jgi:hypothetical protein